MLKIENNSWIHTSLNELTLIISNMELTHLGWRPPIGRFKKE